MVRATVLLPLLVTLFVLVTADSSHVISRRSKCLDDGKATELLQVYISFFENLDPKTAEKYLTPNFFLISASLNFQYGKNVCKTYLSLLSRHLFAS